MSECRTFTVRLDPTEALRVEFVARVDNLSVNDVFRQALQLYIDHKKMDPAFRARVEATLAADAAIASQLQPTPAGAEKAPPA